MTRFTGNSFKITPFLIEGRTGDNVTMDYISKVLNERKFATEIIPNTGWVVFQYANDRESYDTKSPIKSLKLPNGINIVPVTALGDKLDTKMKNKMPPNIYLSLPESKKYDTIPTDLIFFNQKAGEQERLFCLLSTTSDRTVDYIIREFLENYPLADHGYTINKNPSEFAVPSDLITWLIYKKYEMNGVLDGQIKINDISLMHGGLKVPVHFEYKGPSTLEYLPEVKYSIAQRRSFQKAEFSFTFGKDIFQFMMDTNGCIEFKPSLCEFFEREQNVTARNLSKALQIYTVVIPGFKQLYRADDEWFSKKKEDFIAKCIKDCAIKQ
jgi:hypothetical protein